MHASVCAPDTMSWPMPRAARTDSSSVSSNASPYSFCTNGSESRRTSSGTYCQLSLSFFRSSSLCWTQTISTSAARAFSTRVAMLETTASRSYASPTTPFCTSITSSAVFGRFSSVVTVSPYIGLIWRRADLVWETGYAHPTTRNWDGKIQPTGALKRRLVMVGSRNALVAIIAGLCIGSALLLLSACESHASSQRPSGVTEPTTATPLSTAVPASTPHDSGSPIPNASACAAPTPDGGWSPGLNAAQFVSPTK